ncbi:MAG: hypothetical protein WCY46_07485, partial [Tissierellaceae bacterium]
FILDIISEDRPKAIKQLIEYTKLRDDYVFLNDKKDEDEPPAQVIIESILSKYNLKPRELGTTKHREMRNMLIEKIMKETNLSARELSTIIGVSRATIGRVLDDATATDSHP